MWRTNYREMLYGMLTVYNIGYRQKIILSKTNLHLNVTLLSNLIDN